MTRNELLNASMAICTAHSFTASAEELEKVVNAVWKEACETCAKEINAGEVESIRAHLRRLAERGPEE